MSAIQKFFVWILPQKWAASMEAESRQWIVQCPSCGNERSVWELGDIRWKAVGSGRYYFFCPQCQQRKWHKIFKRR